MVIYDLKVISDSDNDIQPEVASLNHPAVAEVYGTDTDRVRVTLHNGADRMAFVEFMESDPGVISFTIPLDYAS